MAKTGLVIRFSMLIAIPSAVGLTVLAAPVNNLLFHSGDNTEAVKMLLVGSSAVVFLSLSTVSNAILQGINRVNIPVRNATIALILHVAGLYVFLMVFKLGIYSVLFANILFAVLMCLFNGMAIRKYLRYRQEMGKTFVLPTIASAFMGAAAFLVYKGVHLVTRSNLVGTLLAVAVAVLVYGALLIKLRCVEEGELYSMPGGKKLIRIARRFRLL